MFVLSKKFVKQIIFSSFIFVFLLTFINASRLFSQTESDLPGYYDGGEKDNEPSLNVSETPHANQTKVSTEEKPPTFIGFSSLLLFEGGTKAFDTAKEISKKEYPDWKECERKVMEAKEKFDAIIAEKGTTHKAYYDENKTLVDEKLKEIKDFIKKVSPKATAMKYYDNGKQEFQKKNYGDISTLEDVKRTVVGAAANILDLTDVEATALDWFQYAANLGGENFTPYKGEPSVKDRINKIRAILSYQKAGELIKTDFYENRLLGKQWGAKSYLKAAQEASGNDDFRPSDDKLRANSLLKAIEFLLEGKNAFEEAKNAKSSKNWTEHAKKIQDAKAAFDKLQALKLLLKFEFKNKEINDYLEKISSMEKDDAERKISSALFIKGDTALKNAQKMSEGEYPDWKGSEEQAKKAKEKFDEIIAEKETTHKVYYDENKTAIDKKLKEARVLFEKADSKVGAMGYYKKGEEELRKGNYGSPGKGEFMSGASGAASFFQLSINQYWGSVGIVASEENDFKPYANKPSARDLINEINSLRKGEKALEEAQNAKSSEKWDVYNEKIMEAEQAFNDLKELKSDSKIQGYLGDVEKLKQEYNGFLIREMGEKYAVSNELFTKGKQLLLAAEAINKQSANKFPKWRGCKENVKKAIDIFDKIIKGKESTHKIYYDVDNGDAIIKKWDEAKEFLTKINPKVTAMEYYDGAMENIKDDNYDGSYAALPGTYGWKGAKYWLQESINKYWEGEKDKPADPDFQPYKDKLSAKNFLKAIDLLLSGEKALEEAKDQKGENWTICKEKTEEAERAFNDLKIKFGFGHPLKSDKIISHLDEIEGLKREYTEFFASDKTQMAKKTSSAIFIMGNSRLRDVKNKIKKDFPDWKECKKIALVAKEKIEQIIAGKDAKHKAYYDENEATINKALEELNSLLEKIEPKATAMEYYDNGEKEFLNKKYGDISYLQDAKRAIGKTFSDKKAIDWMGKATALDWFQYSIAASEEEDFKPYKNKPSVQERVKEIRAIVNYQEAEKRIDEDKYEGWLGTWGAISYLKEAQENGGEYFSPPDSGKPQVQNLLQAIEFLLEGKEALKKAKNEKGENWTECEKQAGEAKAIFDKLQTLKTNSNFKFKGVEIAKHFEDIESLKKESDDFFNSEETQQQLKESRILSGKGWHNLKNAKKIKEEGGEYPDWRKCAEASQKAKDRYDEIIAGKKTTHKVFYNQREVSINGRLKEAEDLLNEAKPKAEAMNSYDKGYEYFQQKSSVTFAQAIRLFKKAIGLYCSGDEECEDFKPYSNKLGAKELMNEAKAIQNYREAEKQIDKDHYEDGLFGQRGAKSYLNEVQKDSGKKDFSPPDSGKPGADKLLGAIDLLQKAEKALEEAKKAKSKDWTECKRKTIEAKKTVLDLQELTKGFEFKKQKIITYLLELGSLEAAYEVFFASKALFDSGSTEITNVKEEKEALKAASIDNVRAKLDDVISKYEGAIENLQKAIDGGYADPSDPDKVKKDISDVYLGFAKLLLKRNGKEKGGDLQELKKAKEALEAAALNNPEDAYVDAYLGLTYVKMFIAGGGTTGGLALEEAKSLFTKAKDKDSKCVVVEYGFGLLDLMNAGYVRAAERYDLVESESSFDGFDKERLNNATVNFETAKELDPEFVPNLAHLAIARIFSSYLPETLLPEDIKTDIEKMQELDKNNADIYYAKALLIIAEKYDSLYWEEDQSKVFEEAKEKLEKALKIDPNHKNARSELNKIAGWVEAPEREDDDYISEEGWRYKKVDLYRKKHYEDIIKKYLTYIENERKHLGQPKEGFKSKSFQALYYIADSYCKMGDFVKAAPYIYCAADYLLSKKNSTSIAVMNFTPSVLRLAGIVAMENRKYKKAENLLQKSILAENKNAQKEIANSLILLGEARYKQNKFSAAVVAWEDIIGKCPNASKKVLWTTHYKLGKVYYHHIGKQNDGIRHWEKVLEIDANNPYALLSLSCALVKNRKEERANECLLQLYQNNSDFSNEHEIASDLTSLFFPKEERKIFEAKRSSYCR